VTVAVPRPGPSTLVSTGGGDVRQGLDTVIGDEVAVSLTTPTAEDDLREIVRLATLAPSVHNSQPWRLGLRESGLDLLLRLVAPTSGSRPGGSAAPDQLWRRPAPGPGRCPEPQPARGGRLLAEGGAEGGYRSYDLVKEFVLATVAVTLLTVALSVLFSSPDERPTTLAGWARAAPADFVATAVSELDGTSSSSGYGAPYNSTPGAGQKLGPLPLQRWGGVQPAAAVPCRRLLPRRPGPRSAPRR